MPCNMRRKPIIALVVGVALLLFIIILVLPPPSPQTITVHHINSVQFGHQVTETFEITNHTAVSYFVAPATVVIIDGQVRRMCFDLMSASTPALIVRPYGCVSPSFQMANLPVGVPLRLSLTAQPELTGLKGLVTRLKLRYLEHQRVLYPFWKTPIFGYRKSVNIDSDEFVEPEPK